MLWGLELGRHVERLTDSGLCHSAKSGALGLKSGPRGGGGQCRVLGGGLLGLSGLEVKVWKLGNKVKVKNTLIGARTRPEESD